MPQLRGVSVPPESGTGLRTYSTFVPLHPDSLHDIASPVNQISTAFGLYLMRRRNQQPAQDSEAILDLLQASVARLQRHLEALQKCSAISESPCEPCQCDANELADAAISALH